MIVKKGTKAYWDDPAGDSECHCGTSGCDYGCVNGVINCSQYVIVYYDFDTEQEEVVRTGNPDGSDVECHLHELYTDESCTECLEDYLEG